VQLLRLVLALGCCRGNTAALLCSLQDTGRGLVQSPTHSKPPPHLHRRLHSLCLAHAPLVPLLSEKVGCECCWKVSLDGQGVGSLDNVHFQLPAAHAFRTGLHAQVTLSPIVLACLPLTCAAPLLVQTGRRIDGPTLGFFTQLLYIVAFAPPAAVDPQLLAGFERSVRSSLQVRTGRL